MSWSRRAGSDGMLGVATALALACGGDDGPSGNAGSIQVAVTPATLSVEQGGSGSVGVSLTRGGGFSGVVTLAITGLPAGVTPAITPAQLSGTTASATAAVTVAPTVALGSYTATVTATAQGTAQATTSYQVTVTAPPGYELSVTPSALAVGAGASGNAMVRIDRTGFTAGVALALLDPPTGITGAFDPTTSTTNASALVVSVAPSVVPGAYPLTIRGTGTGLTDRVTALQLTVTPAPAGSRDVEYRFCDASGVPDFFAYQDGGGAWKSVTGSTSGDETTFAFTLTQGRGGVLEVFAAEAATVGRRLSARRVTGPRARIGPLAAVSAARARPAGGALVADAYETSVLYASAAELEQDGADSCDPSEPTKSVSGTVAGVTAGQYGITALGGASVLFIGGRTTNPVTFTDVPPGVTDFVGTRMTMAGMPPDKAIVFRNLDIPDGGSLPATIDFNGPSASVPATATASITGGAGDPLEIFVELVTANGASLMWFDLAPGTASTRPWAGLGPGAMASGDFHGLVVFATPPGGGANDHRVALKYVGQVTNQTLALGPIIAAPAISQVVAGTYPRFRFQGSLPAEYSKGAFIDVLGTMGSGNAFGIIATGAWLAASGNAFAYDVTMPDVAGLAGFPAGARLEAGQNRVLFSPFGFTGAGTFDVEPRVGNEARSGTRSATISVP